MNELQETSEDEENVITKSRNGTKRIQEGNVTRKAAWSNLLLLRPGSEAELFISQTLNSN